MIKLGTYGFAMSEFMSTGMIHLWLDVLMRYSSSNFFHGTLDGGVVNGWQGSWRSSAIGMSALRHED